MVRLSGEVVSAEQKTIAVEIARQIIGVRGVDADLLKVATKVEDDRAIRTTLQATSCRIRPRGSLDDYVSD